MVQHNKLEDHLMDCFDRLLNDVVSANQSGQILLIRTELQKRIISVLIKEAIKRDMFDREVDPVNEQAVTTT
jgi:hypothetical protein